MSSVISKNVRKQMVGYSTVTLTSKLVSKRINFCYLAQVSYSSEIKLPLKSEHMCPLKVNENWDRVVNSIMEVVNAREFCLLLALLVFLLHAEHLASLLRKYFKRT